MALLDLLKRNAVRGWLVLLISLASAAGLGLFVGHTLVPAMIQLSLGG
jgi:C4-dicarboxylate transporter